MLKHASLPASLRGSLLAALRAAVRFAVAVAALWVGGCAERHGESSGGGSSATVPTATIRTPPTAGRSHGLFPGPAGAEGTRVTGVSDGDTLSLAGVGKVRLIGVDTPEVYGRRECFGREASAFTRQVLRPGLRVNYRLGVEPRDRYGRALAYVWLADGRLFNGLVVERGYARPLAVPPNVALERRFALAARRARSARRGLWRTGSCAHRRGSLRHE